MNVTMIATATGVVVGLIICAVIFKLMNKDGKMKTKYDEMQEIERGRGYKYGFWAIMIYEALMCVLTSGDLVLPFDGFTLHFCGILVGVVVQASYCIWNNAYIGLNTNGGRFAIFSVIIALCNFLLAGIAIAGGRMIVDGQLTSSFTNLLIGVLFIVIGIELFLKNMTDANRKED